MADSETYFSSNLDSKLEYSHYIGHISNGDKLPSTRKMSPVRHQHKPLGQNMIESCKNFDSGAVYDHKSYQKTKSGVKKQSIEKMKRLPAHKILNGHSSPYVNTGFNCNSNIDRKMI